MLVQIINAVFGYDEKIVLNGITADINEGDRIGLVGANGEGKTTLLHLILSQLELNDGVINSKSGLRTGYLQQNQGLNSDLTVYAEMTKVFTPLLEIEKAMRRTEGEIAQIVDHNSLEYRIKATEYDKLNAAYVAGEGYNIDVKIKTVLNGMGLSDRYEDNVGKMSGGEKTRLMLCRLLLLEPELLILDEPTNHLDFATLGWLEKYLEGFKGAILVVSHDRYFLDKVTKKIWDLEEKTVTVYNGNYTKYKQLKKDKIDFQEKEYEKQQKQIAAMTEYAEKNIVRATTSKSAKSRIHQLANMDVIEKPYIDRRSPRFNFVFEREPVKEILKVNHMKIGFTDRDLIDDADFTIFRGERVALIGANGTGKSTLLKKIIANENIGKAIFGKNVKVAYYDQENLNLNPNNLVIDELWHRNHKLSQTEIRKTLAQLMLFTKDIDKKVGVLSGGERAKLAFAVLVMEKGNFLILDEPTNHLDLAAKDALEEGLKAFMGTVFFVSHDRYFVNALSTKVIEIEDKQLKFYVGNYDAYCEEKRKNSEEKRTIEDKMPIKTKNDNEKQSFRTAKQRASEVNNKLKREALEKEISELEEKEKILNEKMLNPKVLCDYIELSKITKEIEDLKNRQNVLMTQWEDVAI
ncbi:MAG: ABC-F family ATP-binding cassette domain-containing protein [Clostridia bacterium]